MMLTSESYKQQKSARTYNDVVPTKDELSSRVSKTLRGKISKFICSSIFCWYIRHRN